ncbi:hypothetical protein [Flexithrix dorotheae]|uniref:hypothetical protein n=1 Tax=Flexithrix dorotheae TaxID=70993 RepID=UPI000366B502|nr:hypothetical protein [Flexithrix dorotheae]
MDLREELLREYNKEHVVFLANYIGNEQEKFAELIDLFLNGEMRVTQRASWVVGHCADQYPELITPYLPTLVYNLRNNIHDAVKRNTVRILQDIDIPEDLIGEAADICFEFLQSNKEAIAIKVFSMTVLFNITKSIPELANELKVIIEDQMPYGSAGFKSRGKKILKELNKI